MVESPRAAAAADDGEFVERMLWKLLLLRAEQRTGGRSGVWGRRNWFELSLRAWSELLGRKQVLRPQLCRMSLAIAVPVCWGRGSRLRTVPMGDVAHPCTVRSPAGELRSSELMRVMMMVVSS